MHKIKQQVLFMQRYSIYIKITSFRYKYYNLHHVIYGKHRKMERIQSLLLCKNRLTVKISIVPACIEAGAVLGAEL